MRLQQVFFTSRIKILDHIIKLMGVLDLQDVLLGTNNTLTIDHVRCLIQGQTIPFDHAAGMNR